jgi:hypothetical protein
MPLNQLIDSGSPIQPPPDVQRTTLGLDVLSRFICSTWDEVMNNGGKPFDAVVIAPVLSPRAEPSQASKCRSTAHPSFFRSIRIAR